MKGEVRRSKLSFFHNSRLIRPIEQKLFTKNWRLDQGLNPDRLLSSQEL